ncbi:MAG: type I-U CRISPR-associated helicase/endonuclease Cas3 [Bryobacteraceae bacterium]
MTFAEFFEAVWDEDKKPFPWQKRLAELAGRGEWPRSVGLPTAAGKTALIDIALYALAMHSPKAARRIFFVVDRRVIVDAAAKRAGQIAKRLCEADPASPLGVIAQALRDLGGGPEPLVVATLRGGIERDDSWIGSPLQPAVICSTVDQVGSSLLFRAYGASEYARPIRAGLAACDSMVILDEAHTSQPFAETLGWIDRYRGWAEQPIDLPFTVVEMSATPRRGEVFGEDDDDRANPVLKRRWEAEKRARLVVEEVKASEEAGRGEFAGLIDGLVREAREMRKGGAKVVGVICNRVATARSVYGYLKGEPDCDAILLTGRARPYDRDRIWETCEPRIGLGRKADSERPVFVIATQCIEVGADIDFSALVTEVASLDALEQRFGRLDRDGRRDLADAVIVAQKDQTGANYDDPVYGRTLGVVWKWLKKREVKRGRAQKFVPMGVLRLRQAIRETENYAELVMPRKSAPVLMPAHVDLLCQTSPEPAVSPEPALFLHGPDSGPADVQVVWRADLDKDAPGRWQEIVAICPPSAAEGISLPIWAVRKWLAMKDAANIPDVEGEREEQTKSRDVRGPVLEWRGADETGPPVDGAQIRPGATIVVPSSYGGCDEWGWDPASASPVSDIGDQVGVRMGRPILRLHPELVKGWNDPALAQRLRVAGSVQDVRAALKAPLADGVSEWVRDAGSAIAKSRVVKLIESPDEDADDWAAVAGKGTFEQAGVGASYTTEVRLHPHLKGCREVAGRFARELPETLRATVARAAALHDIGKADPRFQAWLRGGNPVNANELIAKSRRAGQNSAAIERARRLAGYPKGGRHELMSVALVDGHPEAFGELDFDLLLHLIGSHHGRCRPFAPVVKGDSNPVAVRYDSWTASSDHGLERAGSGVCDRFWRLTRRYGWFGLAYLEALVRLADWRESEVEEDREPEVPEAGHV